MMEMETAVPDICIAGDNDRDGDRPLYKCRAQRSPSPSLSSAIQMSGTAISISTIIVRYTNVGHSDLHLHHYRPLYKCRAGRSASPSLLPAIQMSDTAISISIIIVRYTNVGQGDLHLHHYRPLYKCRAQRSPSPSFSPAIQMPGRAICTSIIISRCTSVGHNLTLSLSIIIIRYTNVADNDLHLHHGRPLKY